MTGQWVNRTQNCAYCLLTQAPRQQTTHGMQRGGGQLMMLVCLGSAFVQRTHKEPKFVVSIPSFDRHIYLLTLGIRRGKHQVFPTQSRKVLQQDQHVIQKIWTRSWEYTMRKAVSPHDTNRIYHCQMSFIHSMHFLTLHRRPKSLNMDASIWRFTDFAFNPPPPLYATYAVCMTGTWHRKICKEDYQEIFPKTVLPTCTCTCQIEKIYCFRQH